MLSSSPEKLRAMKEKMKKVLGSMRKKSTHSGVIDEDIRSTYSAVSMDEPSITSAATSMRTSRSKVGSAFVPVTKTTLPKDISISSPEVVSAKVDEEEDFNTILKFRVSIDSSSREHDTKTTTQFRYIWDKYLEFSQS